MEDKCCTCLVYFLEYEYLSIEDPILRKTYSNLSAWQWESQYPKAVLDEVHKEPRLIESIKAAYGIYVLLGSNQLLLLNKVRESLAGRCLIYELYSLELPELSTQSWEDTIIPSLWQQTINRQCDFSFMLLPSCWIDG